MVNSEKLFWELWNCKNESQVNVLFCSIPEVQDQRNWQPLGGQTGNLGIVENQQANPAAALVEKVINSIDAILMRKCLEAGIDPKSSEAPSSIDEAVERFFPQARDWDMEQARVLQARSIQVLADSETGKARDTSIIIYDAGEGQHPDSFQDTFCSLLGGNKDEIKFVQGRFNMGGSGALPFCGKSRYQLIGSRRYDNRGDFGFTLVRKHPRSEKEELSTKNSWYEYFAPNNCIPAFTIRELDLDLYGTNFSKGTIIKLYSYNTQGNRDLQRDMARSLNEYLFKPSLPYFLVEDKNRARPGRRASTAYGLFNRLEDNEHVETRFTQSIENKEMGLIRVMVYVFRPKTKDKDAKETRRFIRSEFFKNNMAVLFTLNGQVHAHYTSEFITRSLKFDLLKDHLLIHVDCTNMKTDFRDELFMASRDRLKDGKESQELRNLLANKLKAGYLKLIYKQRKENITVETGTSDELLKEIGKNLYIDNELSKLFGDALKLNTGQKKPTQSRQQKNSRQKRKQPNFRPGRYPSFFYLSNGRRGEHDFIEIPLNGNRTLQFDSDVENEYFDRTKDPGELQLGVMTYRPKGKRVGPGPGHANDISEILSVSRQSPRDGKIKVVLEPTKQLQVGDEVHIRANLQESANPNSVPPQLFWVRISDEQRPASTSKKADREEPPTLPALGLAFESPDDNNHKSWEELSENGAAMDYHTVMYPSCNEEDVLDAIYVNMDCHVFKNYRSRLKTVEQIAVAENRYISSVYYHTLFLYAISRQRGYENVLRQSSEKPSQELGIVDYLQDVFASHYAHFLLAYDPSAVLDTLE